MKIWEYLLHIFYISVYLYWHHVYMWLLLAVLIWLNFYLPTRPRSMSRSQKDKTWPKSIMLANFKSISAESVKLMFTMFFYVHMRIFCLVFWMTNFLNCIQSGQAMLLKMLQNRVKHMLEQKDQSLTYYISIGGCAWLFICAFSLLSSLMISMYIIACLRI